MPDLLAEWSAKRLKENGADAVKFMLYYDVDEDESINSRKQAFVERIGDECVAEDMPFFLELMSYDANIDDNKSREYAKVKAHKVNDMIKEFAKPRYNVDEATNGVPYIYLSAGVPAKVFQDTLVLAHEAGSTFNGVLCGRATWRHSIEPFAQEGEEKAIEWCDTVGKQNIESLNEVLKETATSWESKTVGRV